MTKDVKSILAIDMMVKNYKLMCKLLCEEVKTSNSKKSQIKEWRRYFNWRNEGQKFIITEIYDKKVKGRVDGRKNNGGANNIKYYPNFCLKDDEWCDIGVYMITLNNDVYIGSTIAGFRKRFLQHHYKSNDVPYTREMLESGATFQILWKSDVKDEEYIRYKENHFIKKYKKDANWNVININEAWNKIDGSKTKKIKTETRYIKIKTDNYDKAMNLLTENNLM